MFIPWYMYHTNFYEVIFCNFRTWLWMVPWIKRIPPPPPFCPMSDPVNFCVLTKHTVLHYVCAVTFSRVIVVWNVRMGANAFMTKPGPLISLSVATEVMPGMNLVVLLIYILNLVTADWVTEKFCSTQNNRALKHFSNSI